MPTNIRFSLNFSGAEVFEQQRNVLRQLDQLAHDDHGSRTRLYAILSASQVFSHPLLAVEAAERCAEAAQQAGDRASHAWALVAQSLIDVSSDRTEQRLNATREAIEIAAATNETEFVDVAYFLYLASLTELGRTAELDLALSPVGPVLSVFPHLSHRRHAVWFRCLQATLNGDVELAEQLAHRGRTLAEAQGDPDGQTVFTGQIAIIRWAQGRVLELESAFLQARQSAPHEPIWAVSLAWMWLRQGRKSAARALISSLPPIDQLPNDRNWLATACILAEAVSELEDVVISEQLYRALLPYADRLVTIGLGVTLWGTVARPLALTATSLGKHELAIEHYRHGIEVASRTGAHPWLAEMQSELASMLGNRSDSIDEARTLATEAVATGRALQLHAIEGDALRVLAALGGDSLSASPDVLVADISVARPRITLFNGFSVTSADGVVAHWKSRKARQLLKILVARRGSAVSRDALMHMLWPDVALSRLSNRFSVAATTVRRALDPSGSLPRNMFLEHRDGLVRLRVEALDVDVETFLADAAAAQNQTLSLHERMGRLAAVFAQYTGEPLYEEEGELWAEGFRREAHLVFFSVAHTLAELYADAGDHLSRLELYRRIVEVDEFDQRAHEGMIDALTRLEAPVQAEAARKTYVERMDALGVPLYDQTG